jgi:hypothetical protein
VVLKRDMRGKVSPRGGTGDSSSELVSAGDRSNVVGLSLSGIPFRSACVAFLGLGARRCFRGFCRVALSSRDCFSADFCRDCYRALLAVFCRSRSFDLGVGFHGS